MKNNAEKNTLTQMLSRIADIKKIVEISTIVNEQTSGKISICFPKQHYMKGKILFLLETSMKLNFFKIAKLTTAIKEKLDWNYEDENDDCEIILYSSALLENPSNFFEKTCLLSTNNFSSIQNFLKQHYNISVSSANKNDKQNIQRYSQYILEKIISEDNIRDICSFFQPVELAKYAVVNKSFHQASVAIFKPQSKYTTKLKEQLRIDNNTYLEIIRRLNIFPEQLVRKLNNSIYTNLIKEIPLIFENESEEMENVLTSKAFLMCLFAEKRHINILLRHYQRDLPNEMTLLQIAALSGNFEIFEALLSEIKQGKEFAIKETDTFSRSCEHYLAISLRDESIIDKIADIDVLQNQLSKDVPVYDEIVAEMSDNHFRTPLHYAAMCNPTFAAILVDEYYYNPYSLDKKNHSEAYYAWKFGNLDLLEDWDQYFNNNTRDFDINAEPLEYAIKGKNTSLESYILERRENDKNSKMASNMEI